MSRFITETFPSGPQGPTGPTGPQGPQGATGSGGAITFPLLATNGSGSTPSYSFSSEPDVGIFNAGGTSLGIAGGGQALATIGITGIDSPQQPYILAEVSINQSIPGSTALSLGGVVYSGGATFATSFPTTALVAPVAGKYMIGISVIWSGATTSGYRYIDITVGSGETYWMTQVPAITTTNTNTRTCASGLHVLDAGENIQFFAKQNAGVNINIIDGYVFIYKLP